MPLILVVVAANLGITRISRQLEEALHGAVQPLAERRTPCNDARSQREVVQFEEGLVHAVDGLLQVRDPSFEGGNGGLLALPVGALGEPDLRASTLALR